MQLWYGDAGPHARDSRTRRPRRPAKRVAAQSHSAASVEYRAAVRRTSLEVHLLSDVEPIFPGSLRLVQRVIGSAEELVRRLAHNGLGDAEARGQPDLLAFRECDARGCQRFPHTRRNRGGSIGACLREKDRELLAADTSGNVYIPHMIAKEFAKRSKGMVAGVVAEAVVDPLEVVEVGEYDG